MQFAVKRYLVQVSDIHISMYELELNSKKHLSFRDNFYKAFVKIIALYPPLKSKNFVSLFLVFLFKG